MSVKVFVEQHPNEEIRTIHLGKPVTVNPFSKYSVDGLPKKVIRLNKAFARRPELTGSSVTDFVGHKEVRVERNKAFSWEEAVSAAISVLAKFYKDEIIAEHGERDPEWDLPVKDLGYDDDIIQEDWFN